MATLRRIEPLSLAKVAAVLYGGLGLIIGAIVSVVGVIGSTIASAAEESPVPFIGAIPMDAAVRQAGDGGTPVVLGHPESAVARALVAMAEDVAAKVSVLALQKSSNVVPIQMID